MPVDFYKLRTVFLTTLKIGAVTFGGGYAMIPMMTREFVDKQHWIEEEDIIDVFAAAQSLPGVIAINSSIMLGYRVAGALGGLLAALGVVLPSLVILSIVSVIYNLVITNPYVLGFMRGIGGAVCALLLNAVVTLFRQSVRDAFGYALFGVAAILTIAGVLHPIILIVCGGFLGFLYTLFLKKKKGGVKS